jgi:hypothetical protein
MQGVDDEEFPCEPRESLMPVVLATASSLVLGYLFGRDTYRRDLVRAVRATEQTAEPFAIRLPGAF